jgi:hypothetical protein
MRRLTGGRLARLREERGGIAVMLALLMPILFGAAALGIDTAAVWSARQQVQTGADAAVIAVAMDCARGNCGDIKKTAEDAFWANDKAAKVSDLGPGEGWIAVNNRRISTTQKRPWLVNHFFAAAIGFDTGSLSVSSYAEWAPATRARAEIPMAISYCTYKSLAPSLTSKTIVNLGVGESTSGTCRTPDGRNLPGGVALTQVDGGSCGTTTEWRSSYQRYRPVLNGPLPGGCTDAYLASLVGRDVTVPVYDDLQGQTYRVYGYAAFRVTGYSGSGSRTLTGYFTYSARQVDDTTPPNRTAPDLGARSVFLTEN